MKIRIYNRIDLVVRLFFSTLREGFEFEEISRHYIVLARDGFEVLSLFPTFTRKNLKVLDIFRVATLWISQKLVRI